MLAPVELLIFQSTPFCNLDCRYCYLPGREQKHRISLDTIRTTCDKLVESNLVAPSVSVIWHAGEPLAAPVAFYEEALSIIRDRFAGRRIIHKFQTNGTLVDAGWVDLFRRWDVRIGVSIDGPRAFHDAHRRYRSGHGSFDRTLEGFRLLQSAGLDPSAICVLTENSLGKPDELFAFFEDLGVIQIAFIVEEAIGIHGGVTLAPSDFERFLLRYWQLVREGHSRQWVRELTTGLRYVFGRSPDARSEVTPVRILVVGHDGGVGTLSPELFGCTHPQFGQLVYGNIHDDCPLEALASNSKLRSVLASIDKGIKACRASCGYFEICKGGLPGNKLAGLGTFEGSETLGCRMKVQAVANAATTLVIERIASANDRVDLQTTERDGPWR